MLSLCVPARLAVRNGLENADASSGERPGSSVVMKVVSLPIITKVFHRQPWFPELERNCGGGGFSQKRLTRATSPAQA